MKEIIDQNLIQDHNLKNSKSLEKDFEFLGEQLQQRGIRIEEIIQKLDSFMTVSYTHLTLPTMS